MRQNALLYQVAVVLTIWLPPATLLGSLLVDSPAPLAIFVGVQSVLLLFTCALWVRNRSGMRLSGVELSLAAFVGVLGAATLAAVLRFPELGDVPMLTPFVMFILWTSPLFIFPVMLRSDAELAAALRSVDWLGVVLALTVLLPAFGLNLGEVQLSEASGLRRVFGPFGDSIALIMALFLIDAVSRKSMLRGALFLATLLVTVGLGATLVAFVAFGLLVVRAIRSGDLRRSQLRWPVVVAGSVVLAGVAGFAAQGLLQRLGSAELVFSAGVRLASYRAAWNVFADNAWLGVGYTGLKAVSTRYDPEALFEIFTTNYTATAQNQLLQSAADAGLPGVVALLVFLTFSVLTIYRAAGLGDIYAARYRGYWAWALALCFANQTSVWLVPNSLVPFLFCVLVGLSIARIRVASGFRVQA